MSNSPPLACSAAPTTITSISRLAAPCTSPSAAPPARPTPPFDAPEARSIALAAVAELSGLSPSALLTEPQLSSVAQPLDLIGETAATLLLEKIKNPDAPDRTVVLDARSNIRESTDVRPQQ